MTDSYNVQLSVLSQNEPRPGENTYTRRENGGNNLRPDIKQLRTPLKRNIAELFDSTPIGEDDGGSEDAKTPIRTSGDSSLEKPSTFSLTIPFSTTLNKNGKDTIQH